MKVAIVGAGPCGLTSIKCCLDEGLEPVCFEKGTDLGGLWRYTLEEDHACVYDSCVMVTSKEMSCFSDFPVPEDYPLYLPHSAAKAYLNLYADNFNLRPHIRYNTKIVKITHNRSSNNNDEWTVTYEKRFKQADVDKTSYEAEANQFATVGENGGVAKTFKEKFDAVLVSSGHHWRPSIPKLIGAETFPGQIIHSASYKETKQFQGKNILVVGIGDSGAAIATELSQNAGKVYLSTRRGCWITSRLQAYGIPSDQIIQRRFVFDLPRKILDWACTTLVNLHFDHRNFGLLPNNSYLEQPPVVNDYLPYKILSGSVLVKPDVVRLNGRDVYFKDGSIAKDIDVIIMATGYDYEFPFLQDGLVEFKDNSPVLYKHMFRTEDNPTIAFIGCLQPFGCMFIVAETQARLATRVFKGLVKLPRVEDMKRAITKRVERKKMESYNAKKHATTVFCIPYCDELADMIGCRPRFGSLFFSYPVLAYRCYFGPCSPPQYRLKGPGAWNGARRAIMELPQRNIHQMKKRSTFNRRHGGMIASTVIVAFVMLLLCYVIQVLKKYFP